jgi:NADH-quinone oxidoreductase E subunit
MERLVTVFGQQQKYSCLLVNYGASSIDCWPMILVPKSMTFSEKYKEEIADILSRYPVKRSALIPLLYVAQRDQGYVTESAMQEIAHLLRLTPPQVYETITFYTMFNLKPMGKFHIQVCKSLMCALVGSDTIIEWIKAKLGIAPGESTADGLFSLSAVECLAACGTGPMMQINDDYYEQLTENKLDRILADLRLTGTSPLKSGPFMWPESANVER